MTEDRLDSFKLDYIANRSEKGRLAVAALRESRAKHLLKMAPKKKEESVTS
jgi:COX assembly protein 1